MNVSWKGRTFNQIVTKLKKNKNDMTHKNIFLSPPIKQYRRELVMTGTCSWSSANINMNDFNVPGGTVVNSATKKGIFTVDINLPNDTTELPINNSCAIRANDARRRMRSGGNIKNVANSGLSSVVNYCTSSIQYLEKRNRKFDQNNYSILKYGESTFNDGIPSTTQNVYATKNVNECAKISVKGYSEKETEINRKPFFTYTWTNGKTYPIYFEDGEYDLEDLNINLMSTLEINKHYLIDKYRYNSKKHFFKFVYDSAIDRIQLHCDAISYQLYPSDRYVFWTSFLVAVDWQIPEQSTIPQINILNNEFKDMIGFASGSYPPINTETETKYYIFGNKKPLIKSRYNPIYYKPRDVVSASSVVTRLRYKTITENATSFTTPLGRSVASALAYNIPAPGYSYKYIVGYSDDCSQEKDKFGNIIQKGCDIKKIK
jgi:hypothetical protein